MPNFVFSIDASHATARFDAIGPNVLEALRKAITPLADQVLADARQRAADHIRFLGIKPGEYLESIKGGVSKKETKAIGYVRSGSPLAHLLEYGAQTPPHDILPNVASVLKFTFALPSGGGGAADIFRKAVKHPGATIPAYPAINPAFEQRRDEIRAAIEGAVKQEAAH